MAKTVASLRSFVLQHPKIAVGITMLTIALLANPATAAKIMHVL